MPNICEVCGAVEEDGEVTDASSVFMGNLHVCENCRQDRQPFQTQTVEE